MFLSSCASWCSRSGGKECPREGRGSLRKSESRAWLWLEELEERTLLTTAQWNPTVAAAPGIYDWSNGANWTGGAAPTSPGDVAQFVGTIVNSPTLDISETVGTILFNSASNVTILQGGTSTLTLDNTGTGANSLLNALSTNTGTDTFNVPLVAANTPFTATISGGTVQLNNSSGTNTLGSGSTITITSGGTFDVNANTGPLGNLNLGGGTFGYTGAAGTASSLQVGNITLTPGSSAIAMTPGASGSVALTASTLTRNLGATVDFTGPGVGTTSNTITITAGVSSQLQGDNGGILPYAAVNGGDFATYGTITGTSPAVSSIQTFTGYQTSPQPRQLAFWGHREVDSHSSAPSPIQSRRLSSRPPRRLTPWF